MIKSTIKNEVKTLTPIVAFLLITMLFASPALAQDYTAKFETQAKLNGIWTSALDNYLNTTDTAISIPGGMSFTLYQVTATSAWFKFSPAGANGVVDLPLNVGDTAVCLKDNGNRCITDPVNASDGTVKFTLLSVAPRADSTTTVNNGTTSSDTSPVYVYIQADKELPLTRNPGNTPNSFDPSVYYKSQQNGWSSGSSTNNEVDLYFKRNTNTPIDVSIAGCTGENCEKDPRYEWSNSQLKYTIMKVGTYTFNVKYTVTNPWGANADKTDVYKLAIKGLSSQGTGTGVAAVSSYKLYLSDSMDITMTSPGTFTPQAGVGITPVTGTPNKYTFKFENAGTYNIKYTTEDGDSSTVTFEVKSDPAPASTAAAEPTVDTSANQKQGNGEGGDTFYYVLVGFVIILVIGIILIKRRKNGSSPSSPKVV